MPRPLLAMLVTLLVALPAESAAAEPYQRPGVSQRVSRPPDGGAANSFSRNPAVSADGRFVAFDSLASNLVAGDANGSFDVFLLDRRTGKVERVSEPPGGGDADGDSFLPSVSGDGRLVAFASTAANLAPGDQGPTQDVFLADRQAGTVERITRRDAEVPATHEFWSPSISADGSRVAFYRNIPSTADTFTQRDIWVHDRLTGLDTLASVSETGQPADNLATDPDLSADGRFVAFVSGAGNLVEGDANSAEDVFVRDLEAGTTERVSVGADGGEANSTSWEPSISDDGSLVAFGSGASNLVPGDRNSYRELAGDQGASWDVFVRDRVTGRTERVSITSDGVEGDRGASGPAISGDGRLVAFVGHATNLVEEDDNGINDVFVHDRVTCATELVSVAADGGPAGDASFTPAISADGGVVAFGSRADDLLDEPTHPTQDVFARERGGPVDVVRLSASSGDGTAVEGDAAFSGVRVAEAPDPAGDATAPLASGADLVGAGVAVRPERDDVMVRWDLAALPEVLGLAGEPQVAYVFDITVDGSAYRVDARAPGAFVLHRCDPGCIPAAPLTGAIGSGGLDVRVAVPASELGLVEGSTLTEMTGTTAFAAGGAPVDTVALADAVVPVREVRAAVAPADLPPQAVAFQTALDLAGPRFTGTVAGHGEVVWARACLGETCTARRFPPA